NPEHLVRLMLIVRATAQFDIADRRLSVQGKRVHVMKLEESGLVAQTSRAAEGTSPAITLGEGPTDGRRNVASPARAGAGRAGMLDLGHLLPLDFSDHQRQRAIDVLACNAGG